MLALLLLISSCSAQDYSQAFGAVRVAAYKQSGMEEYSKRLGKYVVGQIPYNGVLVTGVAAYQTLKHREIKLKIDHRKTLLIRPDFVSITIGF